MVIPLSLGWLRGLLYLVGSLTWGALACVWVGWCLGWVVSGAQSFFGGVIFGGFLVLGLVCLGARVASLGCRVVGVYFLCSMGCCGLRVCWWGYRAGWGCLW